LIRLQTQVIPLPPFLFFQEKPALAREDCRGGDAEGEEVGKGLERKGPYRFTWPASGDVICVEKASQKEGAIFNPRLH